MQHHGETPFHAIFACKKLRDLWESDEIGYDDNNEPMTDLENIVGKWIMEHICQNQIIFFKCWLSWLYKLEPFFRNLDTTLSVIECHAKSSLEAFKSAKQRVSQIYPKVEHPKTRLN